MAQYECLDGYIYGNRYICTNKIYKINLIYSRPFMIYVGKESKVDYQLVLGMKVKTCGNSHYLNHN